MAAKQRVNGIVIKSLYKLYQILGYNFVYFLLYFVVLYYFLFASNVRASLKLYYRNIGLKWTNKLYFKHLFNYAVTTTDRFISKANPELYSFEYPSRDELLKEIQNGSILLLNHFGGWATASKCFNESDVTINVVMSEAMIQSASAFEQLINKKNEENTKIINLSKGNIGASIAMANALMNNESVALMGDRAFDDKYLEEIEFFGKKANFNKNPFLVAYKTKKPIICLSVVLIEKNRYKMIFESIEFDYTLSQKEAVSLAMNNYVKALSAVIQEYPSQWFNFYDFWKEN